MEQAKEDKVWYETMMDRYWYKVSYRELSNLLFAARECGRAEKYGEELSREAYDAECKAFDECMRNRNEHPRTS